MDKWSLITDYHHPCPFGCRLDKKSTTGIHSTLPLKECVICLQLRLRVGSRVFSPAVLLDKIFTWFRSNAWLSKLVVHIRAQSKWVNENRVYLVHRNAGVAEKSTWKNRQNQVCSLYWPFSKSQKADFILFKRGIHSPMSHLYQLISRHFGTKLKSK